MKRRIWVSIIAICLCLAMVTGLVACSPKDGAGDSDVDSDVETTKDDTEEDVVDTESDDDEEDESYTFTVARSYAAPPKEDGEIKKHLEDKYNVNLDIWYIESSNWHDMLSVRFASNEVPDYLEVKGLDTLSKYVEQDLLAEIDVDMLKKTAPYIYNEIINEDENNVLRYTSIDGKCYALPRVSKNIFHTAIVWRGDWLEKIGMDKYPETFEDFEKAMYAFANEDPNESGQKDTYGLSESALQLVYGAFGYQPDRWMERDGKLVHGSVQPEMKEALSVLNKWFEDEVLDPEFVTGENQGGYYAFSHSFMNSKIGLTCLGQFYHWKPLFYPGDTKSECYLELEKINPEAHESIQFGVPPKRNGVGGAAATAGRIGTTSLGFGKQLEEDPDKFEAMFELLEGLTADYEDYLESLFGIKGKHWDFDEETGLPGFINDNDSKSVAEEGIFGGLEGGPHDYRRAQPRFDWAYENNFDKGCMVDELVVPLPSDAKYKDELEKLQEETYIKIIRGDEPIDYFDEFVEKWHEIGGEQLTEEANEWYEEMNK